MKLFHTPEDAVHMFDERSLESRNKLKIEGYTLGRVMVIV